MIEFFNEDVNLPKINPQKLVSWISSIIEVQKFEVGDIGIIFCSDKYLLQINREYLNHDYYTDIITFNYNNNKTISGDIFISIDTVRKNAIEYDVTFENELNRVIIHGILHLIGFDDKTEEQQTIMTQKENEALNIFPL